MKLYTKGQVLLAFARRLTVKCIFATALLSASAMLVYANTLYSYGCRDGYCAFLSCGSSAGNYWANCPPGGGPCAICDTSPCQETADEQCALKSGGGEGGPAPIQSAQ